VRLLWIIGLQKTKIRKTQEFNRIAFIKPRIAKQMKVVEIVNWKEKICRSYTNECKKEDRVHAEIPVGLRCRNAIYRNFGGVIRLIQKASVERKIILIGIQQNFIENPSIQKGPELRKRRGS
jgi:hypothetical protein